MRKVCIDVILRFPTSQLNKQKAFDILGPILQKMVGAQLKLNQESHWSNIAL